MGGTLPPRRQNARSMILPSQGQSDLAGGWCKNSTLRHLMTNKDNRRPDSVLELGKDGMSPRLVLTCRRVRKTVA
jgi:hypothetical protein